LFGALRLPGGEAVKRASLRVRFLVYDLYARWATGHGSTIGSLRMARSQAIAIGFSFLFFELYTEMRYAERMGIELPDILVHGSTSLGIIASMGLVMATIPEPSSRYRQLYRESARVKR
jgi:hypothetical protein